MAKRTCKRRKLAQLGICPTPDELWKRVHNTDLRSLLCRDEAIAAALAIHDGDPLRRAELEARVLADQPRAEIAAKMAFPEDIVIEYEDWFFDVRDELAMTSWIAHEAVRRRPTGELCAGDVGPFWRWLGYNFGPVILEQLLKAVDAETLKNKGIDAYLERDVPLDPEFKVLILIERMAVPGTPEEWGRLHRCQRAMSIAAVPQSGDLLSALKTEFLAFSELEVSIETTEYEEIEGVDFLCELINRYMGKPARVVQSQAA